MFGLGAGEIVVIVLIILLLFGGRKIPEVMRGLGHGLREFKKATSEATSEIKRAVDETPADPANTEPPKDDKA
jgi:sec-independent protein translocase protein TatA